MHPLLWTILIPVALTVLGFLWWAVLFDTSTKSSYGKIGPRQGHKHVVIFLLVFAIPSAVAWGLWILALICWVVWKALS